ncbi:SDR family NAD(P)-dependent oxidoreductase [Natronoglycomyces albus]|uniref:SDR family oxidoreductase n=1 Tax=Natronoglycomyces albus TaxID=2811108 RepID=A0A895XMZ2_9ACTN|nr:SDR family oxidoreductase [Natronoglycomyces albus]QSB06724.1 SDR family oxidoreductase [Natronoglycomyces albus]
MTNVTWALVTGASSGIGAEFSRQLAQRGHNLILVARTKTAMMELADEIRSTHGREVEVICQDLTESQAALAVVDQVRRLGHDVDVLVNNAGFGTVGHFESIPADREHDEVMLNVVALTDLTKQFIPDMAARGRGSVINVASTAGFNPAAYFAVYSSTKAYVLNFSLSLWSEYQGRGVKVLAVAPGPVATPFFANSGIVRESLGPRATSPEFVVSKSLKALDRNRGYVVPGGGNFVMAHLMPRRPRRFIAKLSRKFTRPALRASGSRPL